MRDLFRRFEKCMIHSLAGISFFLCTLSKFFNALNKFQYSPGFCCSRCSSFCQICCSNWRLFIYMQSYNCDICAWLQVYQCVYVCLSILAIRCGPRLFISPTYGCVTLFPVFHIYLIFTLRTQMLVIGATWTE